MHPGGIDPAQRFAQYGQQTANPAGFPLGNLPAALQGGMQSGMPGARGGLAGLQAPATAQQQAQGHFAAQALQSNLQQLGQSHTARQGTTTPQPINPAQFAANQAIARDAAIIAANIRGIPINSTRTVEQAAANLGISTSILQSGRPAAAGLQGYPQSSLAPNAALAIHNMRQMGGVGVTTLTAQVNAATLARLGINKQVTVIQPANMSAAGAGTGLNPSQDLLSILSRQKQAGGAPGGAGGSFNTGPLGNLGAAAGFNAAAQQNLAAAQAARGQAGGDGDGPTFDTNDFPSLAGAATRGAVGGNQGAGLGAGLVSSSDPYVNLGLRKGAGMGTGEFSMQSEDFPALPGAAGRPAGAGDDGRAMGGFQGSTMGRAGFPMLQPGGGDQFDRASTASLASSAGSDLEQLLRFQQLQARGGPGAAAGGPLKGLSMAAPATASVDASKAGAGAPVVPSAADRYGMLGLMPLLKMVDPDLNMLALGCDLTALGLHLNSAENLHKTLVSVLADTPAKASAEPEFELPACYKHTPQRLSPGFLSKFKEETLFYMFYSMPLDEAQLIAADELSVRGWYFHKRSKVWLVQAPNAQPPVKSARGERGTFLVFDPAVWEVVPKQDVEILYEDIEQPPRLPRPKQLQQARQ